MCGRFSLTKRELVEIADWLDAELAAEVAALYQPRFNVRPTDLCFVARSDGGKRRIEPARWGMQRKSGLQINTRAESFGPRWRSCVIPADGFFEWRGEKGAREAIWFHPPDGGLIALAGLWETGDDGARFTIVTTQANALVAPVHDRMPVVLPPACIGEWLAAPSADLLTPAPPEMLVGKPADPRETEAQTLENPRNRQLKLL
jgi:putative SOS response-associated peptidase YedK